MDASFHLRKSAVRENHAGGGRRLGAVGGIVDSKSSRGGGVGGWRDRGAACARREIKGGETGWRTGLRYWIWRQNREIGRSRNWGCCEIVACRKSGREWKLREIENSGTDMQEGGGMSSLRLDGEDGTRFDGTEGRTGAG